MWKTRLKHSTTEFQIDPAMLAAIGRRFIAKKRKLEMPTRGSEAARVWGGAGLRRRARRPETRDCFYALRKAGLRCRVEIVLKHIGERVGSLWV